jgi:osmotically-inducible protein OsmY
MYPQIDEGDLEQRIKLHLKATRPEFKNVAVSVNSGTVRLSGQLASFYLRQLALAAAQRVAGVQRVRDAIEVPLPTAVNAPKMPELVAG